MWRQQEVDLVWFVYNEISSMIEILFICVSVSASQTDRVSQSVSQLVSHSVSQLVNQSVSQSVCLAASLSLRV